MTIHSFRSPALLLLAVACAALSPARLAASDPGGGNWPMWGGTPDWNMVSSMTATADVTAEAAVPPAFELPAHSTGMDLRFYRGAQFPASYRNALFLALHGSAWKNNGYRVVRVIMKDGRPSGLEDFATGWLQDGVVSGRPAGLATGADGALYVSDDNKGFIYRIAYSGAGARIKP